MNEISFNFGEFIKGYNCRVLASIFLLTVSCAFAVENGGQYRPLCNSVGGNIVLSTTKVCANSNSVSMTLTGYVGDIVQWEQSTDNINFTPIFSTSPNISFSNLGFSWYYRALVNDPGCPDDYSKVATVTAFNASQIGSINYSGNTTVCSGENSGTISLSGINSSVVGWVQSTDNFINDITPIATTSSSIVFLNIATTTSYKGLVQNGVCPIATSSSVTITVIKSDTGFYTTMEPAPTCGGVNSGTIIVQPVSSNVKGWQSSTDNFINDITPISNTNTNYSYSNLFNTTYFRAILQRGTCKVAYSTPYVVSMKDQGVGGSVLGTDVICASISGTGTLTLSGSGASISEWQSSTDNFASVVSTISTVSSLLSYSSLTQTTWFRAVSTGSSCPLTYSLPAKITIGGSKSIGGKITPKYTQHCTTTNFTNLNLSGYTGNILYWEASGNNFISVYTIPGLFTNPISNLTTVTSYRAVVQGNSCAAAYSDTAIIDATPLSDGIYTLSPLADSTVCFGSTSPTSLTFTNFVGAITGWEQSPDQLFGSPKVIASLSNTILFSNLTTTSYFRAKLKNGTCPSISQKAKLIKVDPLSIGGTPTLGTTGTLCVTTNSGVIKLKNYTGKIQYWGTLQAGIGNSGVDSLSISNVTSTTGYFASIKNGVCLAVPSETLYVSVDSLTKPGTIVNPMNNPVCAGINSGTISLTGTNGNVVRWEESTNGFLSILNTYNVTNSSFSYNNIGATATITQIRAVVQNKACPATVTSFATFTSVSPPIGGTISGASEACAGAGITVPLKLDNSFGSVSQYEMYLDSSLTVPFGSPQPWNLKSYSLFNPQNDIYFRFRVFTPFCPEVYSNAHLIKASPQTKGGSVLGEDSIVSSQTATLTLSGFTGAIGSWQISTVSSFATSTTIFTTTSVVSTPSLYRDTYIRALVQSGSCSSQYSTTFKVNVFRRLRCRDTVITAIIGHPIEQASSINIFDLTNYTIPGFVSLTTGLGFTSSLNKMVEVYPSGYWRYQTGSDTTTDSFSYTVCLNAFSPPYCRTCKVTVSIEDTARTIKVYTAISPNNDGINDEWIVDNLESYPSNKVSIYNRWGNVVYQESGYDNSLKVFKGRSNVGLVAGGNELPSATYFYVIDYGNGSKVKQGYIVLNR